MTIIGDLLRRWSAVYNSAGALMPERKALAAGPGIEIRDGATPTGERATIISLADGVTFPAQGMAPNPPSGTDGQLYADQFGLPHWVSAYGDQKFAMATHASAFFTAASVPAGTAGYVDVTVPMQYALDKAVAVSADACPVGLFLSGYAILEDTVRVVVGNYTNASISLPNGYIVVRVAVLWH